jgi:hypothetical protein
MILNEKLIGFLDKYHGTFSPINNKKYSNFLWVEGVALGAPESTAGGTCDSEEDER